MEIKKLIVQLLVIGAIALFLFETVAIAFLHGNVKPNNGKYYKANGLVYLSLSSYEPYIIVDKELKNIPKGGEIKDFFVYKGKTVIETKDTYNAYKILKRAGISGKSTAYFSVDAVVVNYKLLNYSQPIEIEIEPTLKPGSELLAKAEVIYKDNKAVALSKLFFISEERNATIKAKVIDKEKSYTYYVDWEDRKLLQQFIESLDSSLKEKIEYKINDIVYTPSPHPSEIADYVGGDYVLIKNYTNKSLVLFYYQNATFPDSYLISPVEINLSFASKKSITYSYLLELPNQEEESISLNKSLPINSTIELNITGIYSGETLLSIIKINSIKE